MNLIRQTAVCVLYNTLLAVFVSCSFNSRFDGDLYAGDGPLNSGRDCFCKLKGKIDDCSCSVDTVDHFNNAKVFPRLNSLVTKDYFRFFKVNLKKECPFWVDDSRCSMRTCHVKTCLEDDIPPGLKGEHDHRNENMAVKYLKASQNDDNCDDETDLDPELSYLNTTISDSAYKEFELWQAYDDAQDNFCTFADEDDEAQYVDLLLNPERYTGYKGESAHRIWRTIYLENCFRPKRSRNYYITSSKLSGLCLEKRVFFRAISGLHASINIHLSANYLFSGKNPLDREAENENWGYNLEEFKRRFGPEFTEKEGPQWLRNLYFVYLLELRAVAKASSYLLQEKFYTGNALEDKETYDAVIDLLKIIKSFPEHFDESSMFSGGKQTLKLKEEFRQHFRNISRIMDCVGCEKCKLWGKLQTQGLGTALKILFSGKFDKMPLETDLSPTPYSRSFRLERSEIVALFNALARLSTSIREIEMFRQMMR